MADNHKSPLRPEGEDLLQAALSDPFSVPNLPRVSPFQPANPAAPPETAPPGPSDEVLSPTVATTATTPESSVSPEQFEAWKAEYESQVVEWRRQSATVRARAEMERARWEERRAHEQTHAGEDVRQRQDTHTSGTSIGTSTSDWEAVSSHRSSTDAPVSTPAPAPPAPPVAPPQSRPAPTSSADAGAQTAHRPPASAPAAAATDPTGSPNWENVPSSPTSSFPSMSFPEPSRPHSPEHAHAPPAVALAPPPVAAASVTLAVFDDSLSKGARFRALITSLSVNMLLPFVNGVMLGFGEIFAKTVVVGWLGWGPAVATNVGLGVPSAGSRRRRWWWQ